MGHKICKAVRVAPLDPHASQSVPTVPEDSFPRGHHHLPEHIESPFHRVQYTGRPLECLWHQTVLGWVTQVMAQMTCPTLQLLLRHMHSIDVQTCRRVNSTSAIQSQEYSIKRRTAFQAVSAKADPNWPGHVDYMGQVRIYALDRNACSARGSATRRIAPSGCIKSRSIPRVKGKLVGVSASDPADRNNRNCASGGRKPDFSQVGITVPRPVTSCSS